MTELSSQTPATPTANTPTSWRGRLLAAALVCLAFGLGYLLAPGGGKETSSSDDTTETAETAAEHAEHGDAVQTTDEAGKIVWTCSMHPQIRLPEPGQCPICFMDLIPVEEGGGGGETRVSLRQISLDREARRLAEIETAKVVRTKLNVATRLFGEVAYDEGRQGAITARVAGRIDTLHIDTTGAYVQKGQPMAEIYSPELISAQAELIQARAALAELGSEGLELVRETSRRTEAAAREKLRLLGLTTAQIDAVAERGEPREHVTLLAPMGGVVLEKHVVEGVYVATGADIYTIADLSRVWVVLKAYEKDVPFIKKGQAVSFEVQAIPGRTFTGKVVYVDPVVNQATRTVDVRLAVDNREALLKPGMFVTARVERSEGAAGAKRETQETPLVVPASAPLVTGARAVVYVEDPEVPGRYEGREVVLGPRAGNLQVVLSGLEEGEMVVTKGNFKIDSAIQIIARPSMMNPEAGKPEGGELFEAPRVFTLELAEVLAKRDAILTRAESGDLQGAATTAKELKEQLAAVDSLALGEEAVLYWKEFAMLLTTDAVLLSRAGDENQLRMAARDLDGHVARLATMFPTTLPEGPPRYETSETFRTQLAALYTAYQPLMEALAADDFNRGKAAVEGVKATLDAVDMTLLEHDPHMLWMDALYKIMDGITALRAAEDIVALRAGFEPVSIGLTQAIRSLAGQQGLPGLDEVYELYCPMAFDFKGASWLQPDQTVRNPYFGAAMYGCGEVRSAVTGGASEQGAQ